jgi:hypothetical protein
MPVCAIPATSTLIPADRPSRPGYAGRRLAGTTPKTWQLRAGPTPLDLRCPSHRPQDQRCSDIEKCEITSKG